MGEAPTARDHGGSQDGEAGPELVQAWGEVGGVAGASAGAAFATVPGAAAVPAVASAAAGDATAGDPQAQRSPATVTRSSRRVREPVASAPREG